MIQFFNNYTILTRGLTNNHSVVEYKNNPITCERRRVGVQDIFLEQSANCCSTNGRFVVAMRPGEHCASVINTEHRA